MHARSHFFSNGSCDHTTLLRSGYCVAKIPLRGNRDRPLSLAPRHKATFFARGFTRISIKTGNFFAGVCIPDNVFVLQAAQKSPKRRKWTSPHPFRALEHRRSILRRFRLPSLVLDHVRPPLNFVERCIMSNGMEI